MWCSSSNMCLLVFFGLVSGALCVKSHEGTVSCGSKGMTLQLPSDAKGSYELLVFDNGTHIIDQDYAEKCHYSVKEEDEEFLLYALYEACGVRKENGSFFLDVQLSFLSEGERVNRSYSMVCEQPKSDNGFGMKAGSNPCTEDKSEPQLDFSSAMQVGDTMCNETGMEIPVLQTIPDFNFEESSGLMWMVSIDGGQPMTLAEGTQKGYSFSNAEGFMMIGASFSAEGVKMFVDGKVHLANLTLHYDAGNAKINIGVYMICISAAVSCDAASIQILAPEFPGTFIKLVLDTTQYYPFISSPGISITTQGSLRILVSKGHPSVRTRACNPDQTGSQSYLPDAKLYFDMEGALATTDLNATCPCTPSVKLVLCEDGMMTFEVLSTLTVPPLNLSTVRLRDPSCKPTIASSYSLAYNIPLFGCGTTLKMVHGKLVYENEIWSMLRDLNPITRDSVFKLTLRCYYGASDDPLLNIYVNTLAPPVSAKGEGNIAVILLAYPDVQYRRPYGIQDYPVVKYLRELVYLEVQVLNRRDPNIKLALADCWATGSSGPDSVPRWDIIVNGCEYDGDNDMTVFHPTLQSAMLQFPTHYKRFEVKMFTFISKGLWLTNSIYFHCSALICDLHQPDVEVCAKTCRSGVSVKRRRGIESYALVHDVVVASLPGPFSVVDRTKDGLA
ncbi:zona pellucida sperm-binding protein 2 [Amia ocellicauda]|uniref:zona pellucida sperm-binding protein 2 n=1 Tax=Amia ocellicauda TaxID=2972642 RepID=UPI003463BDB3